MSKPWYTFTIKAQWDKACTQAIADGKKPAASPTVAPRQASK